MKKLFQTVDVGTWLTLFKKGTASLIILSMLMSDVANAMEEEHDSALVIQRAHSPKLPTTNREVPIESIEDFFSKRDSSSDDLDSSTGSISTSPEKSMSEGDKSLATSPVVIDFSLILPQSSSIPVSLPLDVTKTQPSLLPTHSDLTPGRLHRLEGANQEASPTVEENHFSTQLSRSLGSSPMGGSLQERIPSFIPPSQSVAESSHNNDELSVPVSGLTLSPANPRPIGGSDSETESDEETEDSQIFLSLEKKQDTPPTDRIQIIKSKRRLFSAPSSFSAQEVFSETSKLLHTVSPKYSIQAGDGSDAPHSSILGDPEDDGFVFINYLPGIEEDVSKCCSCCPTNRPLLPQPTEHTLRGATTPDEVLNKVRKRSELLTTLPSDHHSVSSNDSSDSLNFEDSDSSSPHGSPPKVVRGGGVLLLSDEDVDDQEIAFENPPHPIYTDLQSPADGAFVPVSSPLMSHDLEEGDNLPIPFVGSILLPQEAWKGFLADLRGLPAKAKNQLVNFTHQILHGKSTWPQRLGKWIIGPAIGGGFAYAMAPVYDGGIGYLSTKGTIFQEFLSSDFLRGFLWYITFSAVPDGVSRNAHLWKKGIGYLFRQGKEIGRMCVAGGISFFTAVIPPVYLITAEEYPIKTLGLHGFDNVFVRTMLVGCPFLYLDAFASDFNTAWTAFPEIKEWFGKLFCRPSLPVQLPAPLDAFRKRFDTHLKYLEHFLYRAPPAVIDEIYDNVTQVKEGAQVPFCENYDEALASQQTLGVLCYLLSLATDIVQGVSKPKSIYDISAEIFKYACLILGTPARALALQFIGYSVFELLFQDPTAQVLGGIFALLAFLPQTFMEDQGMDNFFKRFLVTEDPHGHGAHPVYRGLTKLYCILQGLIYTFPLAVLTLQAFQQWFGDGWWPLAAGVPFFIPEAAAQIYSFGGTYDQLVATSFTNLHNTKIRKCLGKEPVSEWKRDWLIRFVQESRGELKHWHPDLIQKLPEGIAVFQKTE